MFVWDLCRPTWYVIKLLSYRFHIKRSRLPTGNKLALVKRYLIIIGYRIHMWKCFDVLFISVRYIIFNLFETADIFSNAANHSRRTDTEIGDIQKSKVTDVCRQPVTHWVQLILKAWVAILTTACLQNKLTKKR